MQLKKKFTTPKTNDPTPIGNLVHWYIKQTATKKKEVAQQLDISPITLNNYFKQNSLQTIILWRIGKAIHYNFFAHLGEKINIPYETTAENELKLKITSLEQQIYDLQKENQLLKEIVKR